MTGAAQVRLGFVPLNDSAPLIVALERGFFAEEGLSVSLSREVSWATIRDKVTAGALDAAHMLAPLPLAGSLGLGDERQPMVAAMALNRGGAAVTLARRLALDPQAGESGAQPLARAIAARRRSGGLPLNLAVVFPFSMHNYLLRYWLAEAGIDPDQDLRISVAPPSRMASRLSAGELDGFCAGEPWNAVAESTGIGEVAVRAQELWLDGPEKVLGLTARWAEEHPERLQACLRALLRAAAWAEAPENRAELAALLAQPAYVDAPAESIVRSLPTTNFHRREANAPLPAQAGWLLSQMIRWGQAPGDLDVAAIAQQVYRLDLYNEAAAALGAPIVSGTMTAEGFADGRVFHLDHALEYAHSFAIGRFAQA